MGVVLCVYVLEDSSLFTDTLSKFSISKTTSTNAALTNDVSVKPVHCYIDNDYNQPSWNSGKSLLKAIQEEVVVSNALKDVVEALHNLRGKLWDYEYTQLYRLEQETVEKAERRKANITHFLDFRHVF